MPVHANLYCNAHLEMTLVEDAAMQESTSLLEGATNRSGTVDPPLIDRQSDEQTFSKNNSNEEVLDFDADFMVPPSFQQELSEEMLKDNQQPFVLWTTLKILLSENPGNVADAMFDCLADFIKAAGNEDKQFTVFPYNLSNYKQVNDLPALITNVESLPEEVDEWLQYFPQAKPRAKCGNVYTAALIGLSMPFTFIKKLSTLCKEKNLGCGNHPFSWKSWSWWVGFYFLQIQWISLH